MKFSYKRFENNPLICPQDLEPSTPGFAVVGVLNPGAFRFGKRLGLILRVAEQPETAAGELAAAIRHDGKYELLRLRQDAPEVTCTDPRVFSWRGQAYLTSISHLLVAWSDDGGRSFKPDYALRIFPEGPYETFGIEDCRVEFFEGNYFLTYTAVSEFGVGVGMISTADWQNFSSHRLLFHPHNKDCALFPERINGRAWLLHRPTGSGLGGNFIWISESADLTHWGSPRCLARTRPNMWDSERIGAGAAPFRVDDGWLEIYHGADASGRYALGALLLDENDPCRILARSEAPLMEPETEYERHGFYHNCIFSNGHIVDGDRLLLYYGAADSIVCGAEFSVQEIRNSLVL